MKLKVSQIADGYRTLANIVSNKEDRIPTKLAYAVARNVRILEPEIKTFEEKRLGIFKELGKRIENAEDGSEQWSAGDNEGKISKEVITLLDTEIDVNIHVLRLEDAGEFFNANDMLMLDWMFTESEIGVTN
jgi:hypothetical protein